MINLEDYGVDPEAPVPDDEEDTNVTVPTTSIPLSQRSLQHLMATVNPLQECSDHGVQLYITAVHTLYSLMETDNLL